MEIAQQTTRRADEKQLEELMSANVVVKAVSHVFGASKTSVRALDTIDLSIGAGEFVSIIGPSGCGKSTLLEIVAGLIVPTSGRVTFDGREVRGEVPDGVGIVFQEDATFSWLSVEENIAFGLRRRRVGRAEIRQKVQYALEFMGLAAFAKHHPAQLSGGMRQRVCIARTLVLEPRLILLDEPFAALDQQTRLLMGEELLRLWRETGASVLLITHGLDEAAMLSDRIGVMSARPGHLISVLTTNWPRDRDSQIISDPRFGALTAEMWSHLRAESLRTARS